MAGKNAQPPPLPQATLLRVVRFATTHGRMIMILSGIFAILAALGREAVPAVTALLAVGCGACERHGADLLRHGRRDGVPWMVAGELILLAVVCGYAGWQMTHFNYDLFLRNLPGWYLEMLEAESARSGVTREDWPDLFRLFNALSYGILIVLTVIYQGGVAWWYHRKRGPITRALQPIA